MRFSNMQEFMNTFLKVFPEGTVGQDNDGQLVIYTNLTFGAGEEIVDMDESK
jgi:hypothetical protein